MKFKFSTLSLLASAVALSFGTSASADLVFEDSVDLFAGGNVETFVNTNGDLALAVNAGGPDATVNGVLFSTLAPAATFTSPTGESIVINGPRGGTAADPDNGIAAVPGTEPGSSGTAFGDGGFNGNTNIDNLIQSGFFDTQTITFGGLTVGQQYEIQIFSNDSRSSRNNTDVVGFRESGTTGVIATAELNNQGNTPGDLSGDSITGSFLADSAAFAIDVFASQDSGTTLEGPGGSNALVNAVQLRAVAVPEPSSLALLGLGSLALIGRRRKS